MGLAPYGKPIYAQLILDNLLDLKPDGSFRLDLNYFEYCTGLTMINSKFETLFGRSARKPEERLDQHDMDIAASIQAVTEEVVLRLTRSLADETGIKNLCLAGGVALNCVANGLVSRMASSTMSGSSQQLATPAVHSARHSQHVIIIQVFRAQPERARWHAWRVSRAVLFTS